MCGAAGEQVMEWGAGVSCGLQFCTMCGTVPAAISSASLSEEPEDQRSVYSSWLLMLLLLPLPLLSSSSVFLGRAPAAAMMSRAAG